MLFNPPGDILVCSACGDEIFQFFCTYPGGSQELLIHGAAIHEIPLPADKGGAAFVYTPGGKAKAAKLLLW